MEGTGVEWSGVEGRGGKGRAGQGRVPDCLGGLSRVGISSRSTRPWNGQPPSYYNVVPRHLSSNSIDLNFLLFWRRRYNDVLRSTLHRYDAASPPLVGHICSTV